MTREQAELLILTLGRIADALERSNEAPEAPRREPYWDAV